MVNLNLYPLNENVQLPKFGTAMSTCFDLHYCPTYALVDGYNAYNTAFSRQVSLDDYDLFIYPGDRILVPTGLVAKIETDISIENYSDIMRAQTPLKQYSIRLHPRSGLSLKRGLVLANAEGIVDVDYQQEIFVLITNISKVAQTIKNQERIAQAEVVANEGVRLRIVKEMPEPYSDRDGGFGSTGV
jgi:dUTP pyrophosphatase